MTANRVQPWLDDGDLTLYHGDALSVLRELPAGIAQTCVTSPPYWGLRDYGTGTWTGGDAACDHLDPDWQARVKNSPKQKTSNGSYDRQELAACRRCGAQRVDNQLGLEATPQEYIERIVSVFREVRRVLRDDGTLWLNLGDSYAQGGSSKATPDELERDRTRAEERNYDPVRGKNGAYAGYKGWQRAAGTAVAGLKPKDLVGIPWRVAFALQADGWYLRSDIIWSKPNPMPESVTDRPTKAHEYLFLFSKQPRYFYDADAIREPHKSELNVPSWQERREAGAWAGNVGVSDTYQNGVHGKGMSHDLGNPAGRNRRSVWTIPTEPFPEAHFATYPQALVQPCIQAGTSERGECVGCGSPWTRIVTRELVGGNYSPNARPALQDGKRSGAGIGGIYSGARRVAASYRVDTTGWKPSCLCAEPVGNDWREPPTRTQLVLDPFIGSGTTALVARKHGRRCIGIDLSSEYLAIAAERTQQLSLLGGAA